MSNIEKLAAMFFSVETVSEDDVVEFYEHINFTALIYAPNEVWARDGEILNETVALAMVLQNLGFSQEQAYRVALVAVEGRCEEHDDPEYVDHFMSGMLLTW